MGMSRDLMLKLGRVIFLKSLNISPVKTGSQCFSICGCLVILGFFSSFSFFHWGKCAQEWQLPGCPVACRIMAFESLGEAVSRLWTLIFGSPWSFADC